MRRKVLSMLLAMAMVLTLLPVSAFASGAVQVSITAADGAPEDAQVYVGGPDTENPSDTYSFTPDTELTKVELKLSANEGNKVSDVTSVKIGDTDTLEKDKDYKFAKDTNVLTVENDGLKSAAKIEIVAEVEAVITRKALTASDFTVNEQALSNLSFGDANLADTIKAAITAPSDMRSGTISYTFKKGNGAASSTISTVGEYSILASISGDEVYEDTVQGEEVELSTKVTIKPKSIADATVVLQVKDGAEINADLPWTGLVQNVAVKSVTVDGNALTSDDFEVSGALNGSDVGEYTVTVTGKGNYTGTVEKKWNISAIDLSTATIEGIPNQKFTGSEITPSVTVKVGGTVISSDKYDVSFADNTYAGTAKVTVTAKADSGYTGTKEATFTIEAAANPAKVTTAKTLVANTGAFDLTTLVTGAEGEVTFSGSASHGTLETTDKTYAPTGEGNDEITVTIAGSDKNGDGTLDYASATAKITVTVLAAGTTLEDAQVTVSDTTYDGTPVSVTYPGIPNTVQGNDITIKFTGTKPDGTAHTDVSTNGTDVGTAAPSNAGTWTVTVSAVDGNTHYDGSATFTISPADLADATIETGKTLNGVEGHAAEYTGTAIDFTPTSVKISETGLTSGTDYTVSGASGNVNVGSYEMTVSAATNQNYTGTKTMAYQIVGKAIAIASATASSRTYDGTDQIEITAVTFDPAPSPALTLGTDFTAVGTLDERGAVGTRNITVEVTMANTNYRVPSATKENAGTVEITAADLSAAEFSEIPDQRYTGTPVKVDDFTVTFGGQTLVKDTDYTIAYASDDENACTAIGTVTVTITGKGNYTGTATTTYEIADIALTGRQISISPESVTVEAGAAKTVAITDNAAGETPVYTLTGVDTKIATAVNSDSTITITGVAAGETSVTLASAATSSYAALAQNITIPVKVTAKAVETPVVSKPAAPEVDTGSLSTDNPDLTPEDIDDVKESASTLKTETADGKDPLSEALTEQKTEVEALVKSVKLEEKTEEIEELKTLPNAGVTNAADVAPVVVTYMEIKVTGYKPADSKLTMEIAPQMMVVLTSKTIAAGGTAIKTSGEDQNAVKLEDTKKPVEIKKPVVIKVTLPASFMENAGTKDIFVGHTTKTGRYEYRGEKNGNDFSFTNPHGFSPFDFTTEPTSGAWIGMVGYENLSKALDEVKDGETITVSNSDTTGSTSRTDLAGKSFTIKKSDESAWSGSVTINGKQYTPDSTGKITVDKADSGNHGGGGGGGGGSSRPSIKPGEKPVKPGTTAPGGGVAGFNDVAPSAWYADSVKYVVDKGLFGGVGNGNFAPEANMTRAMMWTVLARYMGVNTDTGSNWYEAARAWAIEKGISDGTMADGNVTREQFVTMLWRLSGEPAVENGASFTDSGKVSDYAKTAVDWAVSQGIVNGYSDGTFKPQGSATRAEVAKMLTVFCSNAEAEG